MLILTKQSWATLKKDITNTKCFRIINDFDNLVYYKVR